MSELAFRQPTGLEQRVLHTMIQRNEACLKLFQGQLVDLMVETIDEFGSVRIVPKSGSPAPVKDGPILTAIHKDDDTVPNFGPYVNLILFVKNGLLDELQVYKDDGSRILRDLDPENLDITADPRKFL